MLPGKGKSLVDWQVLKAYFKERPDRVCCSRNFAHEIITNKRRDLGTAWIGFSRDAPIAPSFDLSAARGKQVSSCKCGHWHGSLDKLRTDSRFGRNTAKRKGQNLPWSDCFRMLRLLRANWLRLLRGWLRQYSEDLKQFGSFRGFHRQSVRGLHEPTPRVPLVRKPSSSSNISYQRRCPHSQGHLHERRSTGNARRHQNN